ncbi:hypothetical protein [Ureibacillus aquaedulcis]|uniref:Uncharacterized protein n=1 Tax=Ureibacillus aquaedulcis TaxID=3058421 RepID=A0ABT8GV25_9BACL|nr:hypothetical protein [Ureibacillus sp. BA0131]MDN4495258.1 hypothetical protein [Ureibacillus sp. BA0131]
MNNWPIKWKPWSPDSVISDGDVLNCVPLLCYDKHIIKYYPMIKLALESDNVTIFEKS